MVKRKIAPDEDSDSDPFLEQKRKGKSTLEQSPNNHKQMHTWRQVDSTKCNYNMEKKRPKPGPFERRTYSTERSSARKPTTSHRFPS